MERVVYTDPSLSIEEQILLLKDRNLSFENEDKALHLLQNVSMFRMKGYLYPFQENKVNHIYRNGATFEEAYELYCFDSDLRRLLFKRIEQIEVSVRTVFNEIFASANNYNWYIDPNNFRNAREHEGLLNSIRRELDRSDDDQIVSFFQSYSNEWPPSWMAMEVSSFGTLSLLYDYFERLGTLIISGIGVWSKCNVPKVFQQKVARMESVKFFRTDSFKMVKNRDFGKNSRNTF